MMPTVGCCSWSLRPESPRDLAEKLTAVGARNVQLALEPLRSGEWEFGETSAVLEKAGVAVVSGMMSMVAEDYSTLDAIRQTGGVRPDTTWEQNLAAARDNAAIAKRFGMKLVTFHAGFLPHDVDDPERAKLLDRIRRIAEAYAANDVHVGLETGQETAGTLLAVLRELDRPTIGVNFDPANMILYDMGEPIGALSKLAPYVLQLHFKDANRTKRRGEWGEEVTVGTGEVDWRRLLAVVRDRAIPQQFFFEREAGDDRVGDLRRGMEFLKGMLNGSAH
jgi:L-ribulose-5-phosphate 3-epimerase